MTKIYIAPLDGRSDELPIELADLLHEEECEYRSSVRQSELDRGDPDKIQAYEESLRTGRERVTRAVTNHDGSGDSEHSWDHTGTRAYAEFDTPHDLSDLMIALGVQHIPLSFFDPERGDNERELSFRFGMPCIGESFILSVDLDEHAAFASQADGEMDWLDDLE